MLEIPAIRRKSRPEGGIPGGGSSGTRVARGDGALRNALLSGCVFMADARKVCGTVSIGTVGRVSPVSQQV